MSNVTKNWDEFRPSKALWFWPGAGAAVLTIVVGFGVGGWVTGGTASAQTQTATQQAVAQLAAKICVKRFNSAPDAGAQLTKLKAEDSWKRDQFIEKGGWVTFANMTSPIDGAGALCATDLLAAQNSDA